MKKNRHPLWIVAALLFSVTGVATGQVADEDGVTYVLNESFEDGRLPDGWTQEYVTGNADWVVEQGGSNPDGAADGSWRIALRNESDQTQGFVTRLITPPFDASDIAQPILVFSHAQDQRLGDVDELRVYYRTSPTSDWVLYGDDGVYTGRVRDWTTDTIVLTATNGMPQYQLAFEGTDKLGLGVVLDLVQVRSPVYCIDPYNLSVSEPTSTSFRLNWQASFDTDHYQVKVSTSQLSDPDSATDLVFDGTTTVGNVLIEGLTPNTRYYMYVKAFCPGESSGWASTSYYTVASVELPHTEDFNMSYNVGILGQLDTWVWGSDGTSSTCPFINTNTTTNYLYRYSPDSTTVVCFADGDLSTYLGNNATAWLVSPELEVDDIKNTQVRFWGGCYEHWLWYFSTNGLIEMASSLIVGVVEDPENARATFTPIDTVTLSSYYYFDEFTVSFENYTGTGKYVGFFSDFNKNNLFYLDNVTFEEISNPRRPIPAVIPFSKSVEVTIDTDDYTSWEVVITKSQTSDPSAVSGEITRSGITNASVEVTGLEPLTTYYAYVRSTNSNGQSAWSTVKEFITYAEIESLPLTIGFESDEPSVLLNTFYPHLWSSSKTTSSYLRPFFDATGQPEVYGENGIKTDYDDNSGEATGAYSNSGYSQYATWAPNNGLSEGVWLVLPPLDTINKLELSFYLRMGNVSSSAIYQYRSRIIVGVMTDPEDLSTFEQIATFEGTLDYKECVVGFSSYTGEGKFIALREVLSWSYIDDIRLGEPDACPRATGVEVTPLEDGTSVKIKWETNGATKFRVIVDDFDMSNSLAGYETSSYTPLFEKVVENADSVIVDGLNEATGYYVTIRSECDGGNNEWLTPVSFTTECVVSLPFEWDFDEFTDSEIGSSNRAIPACWETTWTVQTNTVYPHIDNDGSSMGNYLVLASGMISGNRDYVVLPKANVDIDQLQVSLVYRQTLSTSLLIGIVDDPSDISTFIPIDTLTTTLTNDVSVWKEATVSFAGRSELANLSDDARVAFRAFDNSTSTSYISSVALEYASTCLKPSGLSAKDVSINTATLYWTKGDSETSWEVKLIESESGNTVYQGVVSDTELTINDGTLQDNTSYQYYVRSICAVGDTSSWTLLAGEFRTTCLFDAREFGTERFEDDDTNFSCWVTGTSDGSTSPYISWLSDATNNDGKSLCLSGFTDNTVYSYAIMPEIDVDSIKKLEVHFSASCSAESAYEYRLVVGVLNSLDELSGFFGIDTVEVLSNYFQDYVVRFDSYAGDYMGNYGRRIMFQWIATATTTEGVEGEVSYLYLDNVRLDSVMGCLQPANVYIDEITADGATISWKSTEATSYRVVVSATSVDEATLNSEGDGVTWLLDRTVRGDTVSITVSDLFSPMTTYYVYVKSICADEAAWSYERHFTTDCAASFPLPFEDDFERYTAGNAPSCWKAYTSNTSSAYLGYPRVDGSYNNTLDGAKSLSFRSSSGRCIATTPALDTDDITQLRVSFDMMQINTTSLRFYVGVSSIDSVTSTSDFTIAETIYWSNDNTTTGTWCRYHVDLNDLNLTNVQNYKYVVLALVPSSAVGYVYIDNVSIAPIPTCESPSDIMLSDVGESSFVLTWTNPGEAGSWRLEYGPKGFTQGTGSTMTVSNTTATITGLEANTIYDVYLKALCDNDSSAWVMTRGTTTGVPVTVFDYTCSFEDSEEAALWHFRDGEAVNKWAIGEGFARKESGETGSALYISNDGGETATYTVSEASPYNGAVWASRTLNLERGEYVFSFDWTCYGNGTSDFMRAGLLPGHVFFEPGYGSSYGKVHNLNTGVNTEMTGTSSPAEWISLEGGSNYLNGLSSTEWRTNTNTVIIEEGGYYNLLFYWRNSSSTATQPSPSAVIDNVKVEKVACPKVNNLTCDSLGETEVTISWEVLDDSQTSFYVKVLTAEVDVDSVDNADSDLIERVDIVNTTSHTVQGLQIYTPYYIYVKAACENGVWVGINVTTECGTISEGYYDDFNTSWSTSDVVTYWQIPDCWYTEVQPSNHSSFNYGAYLMSDGSSKYSMGRDTGNALRFYTASSSTAFAALPAFEGSYDGLQLSFYARAAATDTSYVEGLGFPIKYTYTTSAYTPSIIVGTMSDQSDVDSFVPLDTLTVNAWTTDNYASEDNNWLFDRGIVPLAGATGKYIAFYASGYQVSIYIDNVSIEPIGTCVTRPTNLTVTGVGSSGVNLSWSCSDNEVTSWVVRIGTRNDMAVVVRTDTVTSTSCYINGLEENTTYYATVHSYCDEENYSDPSNYIVFSTSCSVPYEEDFSVNTHNTEGWTRYSQRFTNTTGTVTLSSDNLQSSSVVSVSSGWVQNSSLDGHKYVRTGTTRGYWLVSPAIEIPEGTKAWLTFDAALTAEGSFEAAGDANTNHRFLVLVSEDMGVTWSLSDATEWNNTGTGDYVFNDIPNSFTNYQVPLDSYTGKTVNVAFYLGSSGSTRYDLHIDNVRINPYVSDNISAGICEGYDYTDNGFDITYDNLKVGENTFSIYSLALDGGVDSVTYLTLHVTPMATGSITEEICENSDYEANGFSISSGRGGEFKLKLQSASGCDSVVTLNLELTSVLVTNIMDTICRGQTYTFDGHTFRVSTVYSDTLSSLVTDCDSIVNLYLTVTELRTTFSEVICYGEEYEFRGNIFSESGTYSDTLTTAIGCDSILDLNLTVREEIPNTQVYGYVCSGETYTDDNFVGVPASLAGTTQQLTISSPWGGCDSTLVLHLTLLDDDTVYVSYQIDESQLPFTYHGETYPVGAYGTYTHTTQVTSQSGNCSAVIVATLTITESTGIGTVEAGSLTIIPTLISQGQMEVAVFDMTGRLIFHSPALEAPATLSVFDATGIYTIRALDGDGQIRYGRVIVK